MDTQAFIADIFKKVDKKIEIQCGRLDGIIPYIPENGRYADHGSKQLSWWTNGFWGGILWQLYNATNKDIYREHAEALENRLDQALEEYEGLHHDVGFQWLHTSVANYRLTGNERSKIRALHAANLLAGRYIPQAKFINAWNYEYGLTIIDTLMNLPLLHWANKTAGLSHMSFIAAEHANFAIKNLIRPDGSVHHIARTNPISGEILEFLTGQGFSSNSAWSRGASWAIYGLALSYRYTGELAHLDTAKKVAHYFMAQISQTDYIPLADFRAPSEPVKYDTTAGLCAACGMLEIATHVTDYEKKLYTDFALKMVQSTEEKYANWNLEEDGIIGHGTVAYHNAATHVPIIYGDYFFIEAILRLQGLDFLIW